MATTTSLSTPVYVQQSFLWDEPTSTAPTHVTAPSGLVRPSSRPPLTVPSVQRTTSARRGRCEHVGGILATVLEKYGITIDQLIAEMDGNS
jgi:hypothetical protein